MSTISRGNLAKTYAFPRSAVTVRSKAFNDIEILQSVRFNEGLEKLENSCFTSTGVKRLVLPSSVREIGESAFSECKFMRWVDLRPAKGLKVLEEKVFECCSRLRYVLLGDSVRTISGRCFRRCGLEEITIPRGVQNIQVHVFESCIRLERVSFAGNAL